MAVASSGWIEDRWLKKRPNPKTGKRERTELWGKCKRYRVCGIPGVRKRSFDTRDEAKTWLTDTLAALRKGDFFDERAGEVLLGDYITKTWWPACDYEQSTAETMEGKIRRHIVQTSLGRTPMNAIRDEHLKEWKRELKGRRLADSTMEVLWGHLSAIFKSAEGKRIKVNPCRVADKGVRPMASADTKARAWTSSEAHAIRSAMPARYRIIADLGMHAGLRQGEAIAFSPDDVDESQMVLNIRRQLQWSKDGKTAYFKLPKNRKQRQVPLSPGLLKRYHEYADEFPSVAVTLPWQGPGNGGRDVLTVRLLVTTQWKNRIRPGGFNERIMKPALAAAGLIPARREGEMWGWEPSREMMHHRWRHTYASVQLGSGEDPVSVSQWMGHASVTITLETYAHFLPDNGMRGRTAVDAWLDLGAPKVPAVVDLRAAEPLGYTEAVPLALPAAQGEALDELVLTGARYGGAWAVGAQSSAGGPLLGEIRTETGSADAALAAGLAWVEAYCERAGLTVAQALNLNGEFPETARPYQALGRLRLAPRAEALPTPVETP
ncbi:tyrosine-type recombinase/integrase [Streptomyces sp. BBFR109]|uniref:tyrosine-type recombinase/integrase n=1 Tax=Streptomyces sp. BBFR109 TaxID=3448172 RepID=UPI003F7724F7